MLSSRRHMMVRSPPPSTRISDCGLTPPDTVISRASTPALSKASRCRQAAWSSPSFPTYRVLSPQVWQATTVDAVWPPGSTLEFEYSIFEPRTGYSGNGITVSVAFNPTPTKSTLANCVMEIL